MAGNIWTEESDTRRVSLNRMSVNDKIRYLEAEVERLEKEKITNENKKPFKFPFGWNWKFRQAKSKSKAEMALVIFFNKKNEIEAPVFLPIFSGNMIVYRNKAYEFDPRAIWRMRGVKNYPSVYCIREIDRKPLRNYDGTLRKYNGHIVYGRDAAISNQDIEEVRERGDSTESDEFLIKAALKAQSNQIPIKGNWIVGVVVGLIIVGILIWLFTKG